MDSSLEIDDTGEMLTMRISGPYGGVAFAQAAIAMIAKRCRAARRWRVLIDLTSMDGRIPNFDRFTLGQHAGKTWSRQIKVAVLTTPESISRFFENVAVNNGGNVRIFADRDEALTWLRSGRLV